MPSLSSRFTDWSKYLLPIIGYFIYLSVDGYVRGKSKDLLRLRSTAPIGGYPLPKFNLLDDNLRAARRELTQIVGPHNVGGNSVELVQRTSPEWAPFPATIQPSMVVYPSSTEDVSAIMKICHQRLIPVISVSGGTGLDGAIASTRGGLVIDFGRMDRILEVHASDLDAVVQPTVGWMRLNQELEPTGLWLPVDPSPDAQIGGMIATNCSGTNAYRYGPMKAWTLGLTVVLADGSVVRTRRRPRKSSAGYDLTSLIVGSGGTLGLVTEAAVKLAARPANVHAAVVPFGSIRDAVRTAVAAVRRGLPLGAIELMDETKMKGVNRTGFTDRVWDEVPTLFLKFDGSSLAAVDEQVREVRALAEENACRAFDVSGEPAAVESLWKARKHALPSFLQMKKHPDDTFTSSDVAVPISRMADLLETLHAASKDFGFISSIIGHVGDGNFHFSVLHSHEERYDAAYLQQLSQKLAVEMGGTVTGEHGVGLQLRDALQIELGDNAIDMMRRIKLALDPLCILNPDKIVQLEKGI